MGRLTWAALPQEQQEQLVSLYVTGRDIKPLVEELGLNSRPASVERYIRDYLYYQNLFKENALKDFDLPEQAPAYDEYISLEADDALIISDLEIPDQDTNMLKAALAVGMKYNIRRLIYNGDIIATDQEVLNTWAKEWKDECETTYQKAISMTRQVFTQYGKWFTDQYFVTGNHDNRIARLTGGEVHLDMLLRDTPCTFSRYSYMFMKTNPAGPRTPWIKICHPKPFSENAASGLGTKLWANTVSPEGTKCHIVLGHTHLAQTAWSPDGQQEIASTGCMRHRAQYKDTNTTAYRQWQRGFLMVRGGYFHPYTEFGTNWQQEIGHELWE